jgi:aminopeptidase N
LKRDRINVFALEKANPALAVIHDNLADMSKVLNRLIYQKGGWVLHMLRGQIGTDTFWAGIREYYRTYRNGSATTADFERVMEKASGQDLSWFFRQWLYRAGSPMIKGSWKYDAAAKRIEIDVQQLQPGDVYRLPLEIGITAELAPQPGGTPVPQTRIERIESTERRKTFMIAADQAPLAVALDPNTSTLMQAEFSGPAAGPSGRR